MRFLRTPLICGIVSLVLVGCQSRPIYTAPDARPLYNDRGEARSLVLTSPVVRSAGLHGEHVEPWYSWRNDLVPYVTAGYVSPRYESSVTYTRDSQYISHGQVYDHYRQTTYRRTHRHTTR